MDFVYFMLSRINGDAAIKIGVSWKPELRAVAIRRQIGQPLKVVAVIPHQTAFGARRKERELHKRFSRYRIHGEWFRPCSDLLGIIDQASSNFNPPWPARGKWHA